MTMSAENQFMKFDEGNIRSDGTTMFVRVPEIFDHEGTASFVEMFRRRYQKEQKVVFDFTCLTDFRGIAIAAMLLMRDFLLNKSEFTHNDPNAKNRIIIRGAKAKVLDQLGLANWQRILTIEGMNAPHK